ncbi:MAG: purine-nucleoside phosphorylase [Alphaproteobacteria bacterium]|nr:purine-nucleoside phosphorylase [Alphaproteobacteria bacterium]
MDEIDVIDRGAAAIRAHLGGPFPKTALVLGSGLGKFAETLSDIRSVSYGDIPGFSRSTVVGHAGKLVVGNAGGRPVAVLQGRIHAYEGYAAQTIAAPIRILKTLGVECLFLTNASGGLSEKMQPGTLMIIEDHINFSNFNPLVGPNDDRFGPRFPDMTDAYDPGLRALLASAAREAGVAVTSGIYVFAIGPSFETAAEIRMYGKLGADAVGMSTVPECIVARHCGMKVVGLSVVTNLATGIAKQPLSHAETLAEAAKAYGRVERLLANFLAVLP